MATHTWGDAVKVRDGAAAELRPGSIVAVVGVHEGPNRFGSDFKSFPDGAVYTIEFEDGSSTEAHESDLEIECETATSELGKFARPYSDEKAE